MNRYDFHHLSHVKKQNESKKTLWITLILTLFFTLVEVVGGILANSLALLSDSAHMLSDVLALGLSLTAIYLSTRESNNKYTFGYLRFEILASFLNGLALIVIAIGIFIEGIKRIINPQEIDFGLMLGVAVIGLIVNIVLTIVLIRSTKKENNLNIKSALWHFIGDLLNSVGVIISAILIYFTNLNIFDPIISIVIGGVVFTGGAKIIRESFLILMESVPEEFDLDQIRTDIGAIEGVRDIHELHLWTITTDHHSLTAHVFINKEQNPFDVVAAINQMLKDRYGLKHNTVQIEHPSINEHGQYGYDFLNKKAP
ncbi:cation diffusion facilitator family transporter [Schinkia azotoformans MEV2011]|uniref:Cation diffusion facilitator family transporter n=1 Tax=Schinkia azotoformans MEV2011 TaxID=1348973 RepID=A0A072NK25_SCHAZ|nr:cation diffusion facilitator family transporter [Schinkia azotoformans]KEF37273.1 cation diffusion facilitator family transporter [Schinkia azotoformans MEV2011]MEC1695492.1 cation diffusion facilitator family transporter [Schinkia azotoformans]MEC1727141.1 cation diffusion facilitator family transporter [Schinkia azotoformans]MEC1772791.1 cation diffusion facilitator family transporter [Schinkia azotoformans]MEC1781960.1 cation diffusion facilitator family transporter [Schinkia azotoforman